MALAFETFVLAAATADLDDESAARPHADVIEFRMDMADRPREQLERYDGELTLILTNRPTWEGGNASGSERDRLETLLAGAEHPAVGAVDVEQGVLTGKPPIDIRARAAETDVAVIASTHDFESTPDREEMLETLRTGAALGDVAKLAVTAEGVDDVLDLLAVTHAAATAGDRVATMAMGAAGRHSRAIAPIYGSRIGYAPVDPRRATAPGQYDIQTLSALIPKLQ